MSPWRTLLAALWTLCSLACDQRTGSDFVPLASLCEAYAGDLCAARVECCEAEATCEASVEGWCNAERTRLEQDGRLAYDAAIAAEILERQRRDLTDCVAPYPVAHLFQGVLQEGDSCPSEGPEALVLCSGELQCKGDPGRCEDGDCASDNQCESGEFCADGSCSPARADGVECERPRQCLGGGCISGTCTRAGLCE